MSEIERLGRALLSQLSSMTGTRATVTATVASVAAEAELQPNAYAYAVIDGTARDALLFKVAHNPATVQPFLQGGAWTVEQAGTSVTFAAMSGGARWNVPVGTVLKFSPALEGIESAIVTACDGLGASSPDDLQHLAFFDDMPADIEPALAQAGVSAFPAIILAWLSSSPAEGRTAGMAQGRTRKSRKTRVYFENFVIYAVASKATSLEERRRVGFRVIEESTGLITDRKFNDDGERLTALGTGVEIMGRARYQRIEGSFLFLAQLRCLTTLSQVITRTFNPWDVTRARLEHTDDETPPEPRDELYGPDPSEEMPDE
jgi:hypothetical protein